MARAFEVKLDATNTMDTGTAHAPAASNCRPIWPDSVEAVLGLDDRPQAKPHFRMRGRHQSMRRRRRFPIRRARWRSSINFRSMWTEPGETVGIMELGGGYKPADLKNYFASLGREGANRYFSFGGQGEK